MRLKDIAETLRNADRQGDHTDNPEGSRYIKISETQVKQWLTVLAQNGTVDLAAEEEKKKPGRKKKSVESWSDNSSDDR